MMTRARKLELAAITLAFGIGDVFVDRTVILRIRMTGSRMGLCSRPNINEAVSLGTTRTIGEHETGIAAALGGVAEQAMTITESRIIIVWSVPSKAGVRYFSFVRTDGENWTEEFRWSKLLG